MHTCFKYAECDGVKHITYILIITIRKCPFGLDSQIEPALVSKRFMRCIPRGENTIRGQLIRLNNSELTFWCFPTRLFPPLSFEEKHAGWWQLLAGIVSNLYWSGKTCFWCKSRPSFCVRSPVQVTAHVLFLIIDLLIIILLFFSRSEDGPRNRECSHLCERGDEQVNAAVFLNSEVKTQ